MARLIIGIGCTRAAPRTFVESSIERTLRAHGLSVGEVRALATLDRKRDEPSLRELAGARGWALALYAPAELDRSALQRSARVEARVGTGAVAEPAALLAAGAGATLLVRKTIHRDGASGHALSLAVARCAQGASDG